MKRSFKRTSLQLSKSSRISSSSTSSVHSDSLVSHQQVRNSGSHTFWNDNFHERYEPDELDKHYGVKTMPQWGGSWNLAVIATASAIIFIFFAVRRYWGQFLVCFNVNEIEKLKLKIYN